LGVTRRKRSEAEEVEPSSRRKEFVRRQRRKRKESETRTKKQKESRNRFDDDRTNLRRESLRFLLLLLRGPYLSVSSEWESSMVDDLPP
jgi:hypothetical protein